jgi:hypothetical protein
VLRFFICPNTHVRNFYLLALSMSTCRTLSWVLCYTSDLRTMQCSRKYEQSYLKSYQAILQLRRVDTKACIVTSHRELWRPSCGPGNTSEEESSMLSALNGSRSKFAVFQDHSLKKLLTNGTYQHLPRRRLRRFLSVPGVRRNKWRSSCADDQHAVKVFAQSSKFYCIYVETA